MDAATIAVDTDRYASCIAVSKRIRWDIDEDVIRGRSFDFSKRFLPDGLALIDRIEFLDEDEKRLLSQIQGRTYANVFGLVERFIGAKILEISRDHWLGDQVALEALVRFTDEELKHQALFRRIEGMIASDMPAGYEFVAEPNSVARAVLGKSTWSVLALTCLIELFTQAHYEQSIAPDAELSDLYRDVFLYHWKEESQHARLDELEWVRVDARLSPEARDRAVDDLIELVGAVDGILQAQSAADAGYFARIVGRPLGEDEQRVLEARVLEAYRWQHVLSGARHPKFASILGSLTTEDQRARIGRAVAAIA